jgi:hypothetical protein
MKPSRPSVRAYLALAKATPNPVLELRANQSRKDRKICKAVRS